MSSLKEQLKQGFKLWLLFEILLQFLVLWKIVDKSSKCIHNCDSRYPKVVAETLVIDFLKLLNDRSWLRLNPTIRHMRK